MLEAKVCWSGSMGSQEHMPMREFSVVNGAATLAEFLDQKRAEGWLPSRVIVAEKKYQVEKGEIWFFCRTVDGKSEQQSLLLWEHLESVTMGMEF